MLGPLDDAVVAAAALRHLIRKAGSETVYEHWRGERATISRVIRLFGLSRCDETLRLGVWRIAVVVPHEHRAGRHPSPTDATRARVRSTIIQKGEA